MIEKFELDQISADQQMFVKGGCATVPDRDDVDNITVPDRDDINGGG